MNSAPAIGIDLGTTFSLAAVYRNGRSEVIPNPEGHRLIPSFVFYRPESLEVLVGETAEHLSRENRENFLFDQKRLIGRKYHDAYVQKLKNDSTYKFKIVQGDEDKAEIELIHDGVKVRKSPEQACSEIMRYIRSYSSNFLKCDVTEAVISVPAHFSNAQRKATRSAAELAGFKVLKLVTEPVAGAIHYAQDRLKTQSTLLVFDFGGGTLDVSIIAVNKKTFEVRSVEGDTFLGGRDFDQILVEHFRKDIIETFDRQSLERLLDRLRKNCIKIKQKLSTTDNYHITIEFAGRTGYKEHTLSIARSKFEELIKHLTTRSMSLVDKCLKEAGLSKEDISDVVLVGGTTRVPKVRELLSSYFNNKDLRTDLNPDEAVALGAAVQASLLKNNLIELEKYKITEVTPLSIGVGLFGDLMHFVLKKNTPLPFRSTPITRRTTENNQKSALFPIFEGERKNFKYNNLLGSFYIENIPEGMAGAIMFKSIFSLDEDGILEVEAFETTTGKRNKLVVTVGEYRLCEYKIKNIMEDAASNLREDEIFEKFILYKTRVQELCKHIIYYINDIFSRNDRKFLETKCQLFMKFSDDLEYTKIDSLRTEYTSFRGAVKPVVQQHNINVALIDDSIILNLVLEKISARNQLFQSNSSRWSTMA